MGKRNGFVIVIKRSDKGDSRKARVTLACERGGTYRHAKNKSIYIENYLQIIEYCHQSYL